VQDVPQLNGRFTSAPEALRNGYGYETLAFAAGPWFDRRNSIWQGFRASPGGFMMQGTVPLLQKWMDELDPNQPLFLMLHTFEVHDPYGAENHPWPKPKQQFPPEGFNAGLLKLTRDGVVPPPADRRRARALPAPAGSTPCRPCRRSRPPRRRPCRRWR